MDSFNITDGDLPMVKCKTCNRPIGKLYNRFIKIRDEFQPTDDQFMTASEFAFKQLKINNLCCRDNLHNPPRIPMGGFVAKVTHTDNTFVIGEHGVSFGDPSVLDFLNSKIVEETKRSMVSSGAVPVLKRLVPTSNVRYGKKFTLSLLELSSGIIDEFINLNINEQDTVVKALWEVFLASMYMRGWKGPGYGYPVMGTGNKVPRKLNQLLIDVLNYIKDNNLDTWNQAYVLRDEISLSDLPDKDQYLNVLDIMMRKDKDDQYYEDLLSIMLNTNPEWSSYTITPDQIIGYMYALFEQASQLIGSLIVDLMDVNKTIEHIEMFHSYENSTNGTRSLISKLQAINYIMGQPVRQNYTLNRILSGDERTLNASRIIALTAYYTLELLTGKTIDKFDPKIITGDESGIVFPEISAPFSEFKI